jgi:hypothetical protein
LTDGCRGRIGAIFQALVDSRRPVSRHHFRDVDLISALHLPDLLGAALFRGLAILGRNCIRVDQLLRESRFREYAHGNQTLTAKMISWKCPQSVFERSGYRFAKKTRQKTKG